MKSREELLSLFLERSGNTVVRIPLGHEYRSNPTGYQESRVTCIRRWDE